MTINSPPVLWHELITEMQTFTRDTGWGLAAVWAYVHRGDYHAARRRFDAVLAEVGPNAQISTPQENC